MALVGVSGLLLMSAGICTGAIVAGWLVDNVEIARQHPVIVALGATAISFLVLVRAFPWTRLLGPLDGSRVTYSVEEFEERSRSRLDGLSRSRWMAVVGIVAVLIALVLFHNTYAHFATDSLGQQGDREWYVYLSWKIGQAIRSGSSIIHLHGMTSPYGYNLLVGDGSLPPVMGGAINVLFGPIVAYNLLLMSATVLGVISGVYLASKLTSRRSIQLVTAIAIATAPVLFVRLQGHLSLTFAYPVTLCVAEAIEIARRDGRVNVRRVACWMFLAFGSSIYLLLISAATLLVAATYRCLRDPRNRVTVAKRFGTAMLIVGILLAPFMFERLRFASAETRAGSFAERSFVIEGETYNADVLSLSLPTFPTLINLPETQRFSRNIVGNSGEGNFSFPGILLLLLGVGGLVAVRRRELKPILYAAIGLWVLTLGPVADVYGSSTLVDPITKARVQWLPFQLLGKLPLLSGLRAPGRLSLGLPAMLGAGLAAALNECAIRKPTWRWKDSRVATPLMITASALLLFNVPTFRPTPVGVSSVAAKQMLTSLKILPGRPGSVLPVPSCQGELTGLEASLQIWHRLDLVGCEGPYLALPFASQMGLYRDSSDLASLRCQPNILGYVQTSFPANHAALSVGLSELRYTFDVRFLLINRSYLVNCPQVQRIVHDLERVYRVIPGDDQWETIDIDSPTNNP